MHRDLAVLVYTRHIQHQLPMETVVNMIREAVEVEKNFVCACLPYNLMGMNKQLMCQYVEFVADGLAQDLISKPIYESQNPFPWMNLISMQGKTNFFEKKVSSYSRQAALVESSENVVGFDADF